MAVRAEIVQTKPATRPKANGRPTHGTPEGTRRVAGSQGQARQWQGGDEGPLTSATVELVHAREVLQRFHYHLERMNHLGQEQWANLRTNVFLEPGGTWEARRKRDGKALSAAQGAPALEKFLAARAVETANIVDLVAPR